MRARFGVAVALLLLLSACATDRSALYPVGVTPRTDQDIARLGVRTPRAPRTRLVATSSGLAAPRAVETRTRTRRVVSVPARTMTAKALAGHMHLQYADACNHVLLSDAVTRVRIYKDSGHVSVGGKQMDLPTRTRRKGRSLIVPASMVRHVARAVAAQRKDVRNTVRRDQPYLIASEPRAVLKTRPAAAPKSIFDMPAPVRPRLNPSRSPVSPDAGWSNHVRPTRAWRWIVVHHSDDTRGNFAKYDRIHREVNHWDECGYHFVIGNGSLSADGRIEHGGRWHEQKWGAHCKTCDNRFNDFGIGICLVGDFEADGRPTRKQMDALVRLCRWLVATYGIDERMIMGHSDAKPTACPGRHFPWTELRRRVAAR